MLRWGLPRPDHLPEGEEANKQVFAQQYNRLVYTDAGRV